MDEEAGGLEHAPFLETAEVLADAPALSVTSHAPAAAVPSIIRSPYVSGSSTALRSQARSSEIRRGRSVDGDHGSWPVTAFLSCPPGSRRAVARASPQLGLSCTSSRSMCVIYPNPAIPVKRERPVP